MSERMIGMDKLAVIVPCYNEEEVLKIASETEGKDCGGQLYPVCE